MNLSIVEGRFVEDMPGDLQGSNLLQTKWRRILHKCHRDLIYRCIIYICIYIYCLMFKEDGVLHNMWRDKQE